jgi:DNA (cytosine-5)-methyltransferase 1
MNVLSLFSGVGGMDLGLERAGHTIVAMCEIDKHARSILAHHWPDVPIHTDVTELDGKQYAGRIDLVAGGSPCQDLSVAGQRKGLDGARSGLFWHQCRIADQSAARWVLWENVPGALSSNQGADFAAVLWGLTGTHPRVPDGGWNTCGVVVGPKRWAVWRLLDAQWFGVAQRRRRVFVVAGAGTECRPEILFESEGMFGRVAPSRTPGEEIAATLGGGTPGGGPKPDTDRMTFVKVIRSGARDEHGELPPEVWDHRTTSPTLNQFDNNHETRATVLTVYGRTQFANYSEGPVTLNASMVKRPYENMAVNDTAVRRLTPIECERLMGWPDNWTHTTADGKQQADSHRYRQIGNGVATPVAQWIGNRLPT